MPERLFEKMKAAGCYNLFIGLESGSDRVLALMKKGFTLKEAILTLRKLKAAGLHCEVSLITDFPGESDEDFAQTMSFLAAHRDLIPKIGQMNCVQYLPGTPIAGQQSAARLSSRSQRLVEFLREQQFIITPEFMENLHYA
jgi:radical SAM superfamily enzyme YgiQ (UPF0313 family)